MLTLSKINSANLRDLTKYVSDSIRGQELDYELVRSNSSVELDESECKASVAAIRWILESASGSDADGEVLESELQQLGLPKDRSSALKEVYEREKEELRKALKQQSLKASANVKWNCEVKGIRMGGTTEPVLRLDVEGSVLDLDAISRSDKKAEISQDSQNREIYLLGDQLDALIYELQKAYEEMKT